jgi:predicted nucleotidyltransferase
MDESVAAAVRRYIQTLQEHGLEVRRAVVFGSQATGSAGNGL